MICILLILLVIDIAQGYYIKHLKKEICLRDGTYKPKPNRFLRLFRKNKDNN